MNFQSRIDSEFIVNSDFSKLLNMANSISLNSVSKVPILTLADIETIVNHINNEDATNIVILSGAGVSTNSGIPERSK
jgi:hypothetical protein